MHHGGWWACIWFLVLRGQGSAAAARPWLALRRSAGFGILAGEMRQTRGTAQDAREPSRRRNSVCQVDKSVAANLEISGKYSRGGGEEGEARVPAGKPQHSFLVCFR